MSANARADQGSSAPVGREAQWPWFAALALFTGGLCWGAFEARTLVLKVLDDYHVDAVMIELSNPWSDPKAGRSLLQRLRTRPEFEDTGCCASLTLPRYVPRKGEAR